MYTGYDRVNWSKISLEDESEKSKGVTSCVFYIFVVLFLERIN